MSFALDGLASGLGTTDLINQLIQLERRPQQRLMAKKSAAEKVISTLQGLNSKLAALRDTAASVATATRWEGKKATSSSDAIVTASATNAALAGSFSFSVTTLAKAGGLASAGTVSSLSEPIVAGALLFPDATAASIGVSQLSATGLAVGEHTIQVTQASAPAVRTGANSMAASINIANGSNALNITINGVAQSITITNGTYTPATLVAELQSKLGSSVVVSKSATDVLTITTVREGSAASIQVTGGNARASLGLSVPSLPVTNGTDAIINVDGQVNTITSVTDGQVVNLTSGTGGTFMAEVDTGFRVGTWTGSSIDAGGGTLAEVVDAINDADIGVSAMAVQVSPGQYRLQLNATETGVENDISFATNLFAGTSLGMLLRTQDAVDAAITVGTGPGAYTITSSSNTISDALPGVSLTLKDEGDATVTIAKDSEAIATALTALVASANAALTEIKNQTAYNSAAGTGGLLMGNFAVRQLQTKLINAVIDPVLSSALQSGGLAGVSTTKDGLLKFDKAKFLEAFEDDPTAVTALFRQGGTSTSSAVGFYSSTDKTLAGDYAVNITTAAEQAEKSGNVTAGSVISLAETIDIRVGGASGTTVSYAASAGESLTSIATELNELLAAEDLAVSVTVEGGAIVVRSDGYGTGSKFEVRSSLLGANQSGLATVANTFEEHAGVNVAGTINGVAATGTGRLLQAPSDDQNLAGLVLEITAGPGDLPLGATTFSYIPGVAQRLASVSTFAIDSVSGTLTGIIESRESEVDRLQDRIDIWELQIARRAATLRRQFTAMEMALQQMQGQSKWLSGALAGLQANSAAANS